MVGFFPSILVRNVLYLLPPILAFTVVNCVGFAVIFRRSVIYPVHIDIAVKRNGERVCLFSHKVAGEEGGLR